MINKNIDSNVGNNDFTDSVKSYYKELSKYQPISKERERELMVRAKNGDIKARNEIITANLRFVFDIAKKYRGKGVDICDLISEGNNGVIKAIEKFDMKNDVKFFTYAVWWIRQKMMHAIEEKTKSDYNELNFDDAFPQEHISLENISYDENEPYDENDLCYDFNYDETEINKYEIKEECSQKNFVVQKLLASLDEKEKVIIMKYFGIEHDDDGESLDEISKEMNMSTERVRQLKLKAIDTMRSEVFCLNEAKFLFG